jgi:hypothetical protein
MIPTQAKVVNVQLESYSCGRRERQIVGTYQAWCGMHFKPDRRNGAYICGGYVKHRSAFCSSHIIEQQKLDERIKIHYNLSNPYATN